METTRQQILGILRRRGHATVEELREALSLAPATVRRHLDILSRDGHVEVTQVRRATGRPHYLFSLSESGEDLFPKRYARITNRLIEEIVSLTPDETSGRGGSDLADLVFDRMAQRLAQRVRPRIRGARLPERLETATQALAEEGITFDAEPEDSGYLLIGHGCPCPRAAGGSGQVCAHDQRLLSVLLNADVTSVDPTSVGREGFCAYRVCERARENGSSGPPERPLPPSSSEV